MAFEQFVEHATEAKPVGARIVCRPFGQNFGCHVAMRASTIRRVERKEEERKKKRIGTLIKTPPRFNIFAYPAFKNGGGGKSDQETEPCAKHRLQFFSFLFFFSPLSLCFLFLFMSCSALSSSRKKRRRGFRVAASKQLTR